MQHTLWAFERTFKRLMCYFILLPLCIVLWPFVTAGEWLAHIFYEWKEW